MRSLLGVLLLLLFAAPAHAEERTWTIATGTFAMAAELVEVRGDIVYLKTADRVEHIPLARLSAADMQYLAALPPSQIYPGPADEPSVVENLPALADELKANAPSPVVGPVLVNPATAAQLKAQQPTDNSNTRTSDPGRASGRYGQTEEVLPLPPSVRSRSRAATTNPRTVGSTNVRRSATSNSNVRRTATAPRQNQNQTRSADRNRSRSDDRPGLFGFRSRRGN